MDLREFVARTMERTRGNTLNMVKDLTDAQLRWRPATEANPIGFLLFHIFRSQDRYAHRWLSKKGEVWFQQGWASRFKLPVQPPDQDSPLNSGNSWTSQQVGAFQPPPLADLLAYGEAVHKSALEVVRGLDLGRLDERPNPRFPNTTLANYLQNSFTHELEHQGQIDYVLGLMKTAGAR